MGLRENVIDAIARYDTQRDNLAAYLTAMGILSADTKTLAQLVYKVGIIQSQGAQTITPSTVDQIIPAGKYLSGDQTIKGDANLVAGNIKNGVTIFGVTGTFESGGLTINIPGMTLWLDGANFLQAWQDQSGNGNGAIPYNGVAKVASGVQFDGINDYCLLSNGSLQAGTQVSMCLKSYFTPASHGNYCPLWADGPAACRQLALHSWGDGRMYFDAGCTTGGAYDRMSVPIAIGDYSHKWLFWTFTKNCTTGIMKIYLNKNVVATLTGATKPILAPNMIWICQNYESLYRYPCIIDHLSIYNRELQQAEINSLYDVAMA